MIGTHTQAAKLAVSAVFLLNGLAFASWVSRVPAIRDTLSLTPGQVGLLLLCLSAGTAIALPVSGVVVHRLGPARTVGVMAGAVTLGLLGMATGLVSASVPLVAVGMFVYGVGTSTWDVAMNVEAADVERRLARTIMPRFHAGFSAGTVTGALLGAASARAGIDLAYQLIGTALLVIAIAPLAVRWFLPVPEEDPHAEPKPNALVAWREPRTLLIGCVVLSFALAEGIANDWIALAFVDGYDVSDSLAAIGYALFVTAMTVGRLFGGALVERTGRVTTLRVTGALVAAGVAVVVFSPNTVGAMTGAVLWGVGASLGFPLGMSAAADDEHKAAARVAVVSSIGYAAFLGGPPVVGLLADHLGVLQAIVLAAGAGLAGALLAKATAPAVPPDGGSPDDAAADRRLA